jgi:hypothetical protein
MRLEDSEGTSATAIAVASPPLEIDDDAREVIAEMKISENVPQLYELLCETFGGIKSVLLASVPDYEGEGVPPGLMFEIRCSLTHPEFSRRSHVFHQKIKERFGFEVYRRITLWQRSYESA